MYSGVQQIDIIKTHVINGKEREELNKVELGYQRSLIILEMVKGPLVDTNRWACSNV